MAVMTDNEARQFTGESPTETAAMLLWFTGRAWARKLVAFQIRSLCNFTKPPARAIAFWATALLKLEDLESADRMMPSPRRLAAFKSMEARAFQAGLLK